MPKLEPPRPRPRSQRPRRSRLPRRGARTEPNFPGGRFEGQFEGQFEGPSGTVRMRRKDLPIERLVIHPGDLIANRYRVERIVERDHGLLLHAKHELFGQPVSLRLFPSHMVDGKSAERMRRQARAVAELDSEHVARILDAGMIPGGGMYVAREHVDGDSLIQRARAAGGLEIDEVIAVFVQICEAVQEAHARGIVIRDLRPEHLLVMTKKSGEPVAKIMDLGACGHAQKVSVDNSCIRSDLSPWASPELVRQERQITAATDIWSLGCLLYELLCGGRPFKGNGPQLMLAINHDAAPVPSRQRKGVPRVLDNVVRWALDKDPARRPRSVHALVHALWPLAKMPGQLLIDRIARLAINARRPQPESWEDDPTNVMSRALVSSLEDGRRLAKRPANDSEPPSLVTPIIPAPVPVPSMDLLDDDDPLANSARRKGLFAKSAETALTPV